jgi:hypothetical protein
VLSAGTKHKMGLGFRVHSGWTALVVLEGSATGPVVTQRRRVELSSCLQPYHAAERMALPAAAEFLKHCQDAAVAMAEDAVREIAEETARACVLLGAGRPMRDLAKTLGSHVLIHAAEGEFFRNAVTKACESCRLAVLAVKEREVLSRCMVAFGLSADDLQGRVAKMGKEIGPPWRQDEKLCALAAWLALTDNAA